MKIKTLLLALSFICFTQINAQENTQDSADTILKKAYTEAKKGNKRVLLMFHASWCGWCHKMDKNMADPAVKDYFDKNFVITHLTVMEAKDKKHLENPGAMELMKKHKAEKGGIPFWIIYNKKGKMLTDSRDVKGNNLGCPASKTEVAEFIGKLKKTTKISSKNVAAVTAVFSKK